MKKIAVIGDNCIDLYPELDRYYETGNVVDTGANMIYLGYDVSIITTIGTDDYSKKIGNFLKEYGFDTSHVTVKKGACAITYMELDGIERIHGEYVEGVLENIKFTDEDVLFASKHDLVHSALWGRAEEKLKEIKALSKTKISFDYADRLEDEIIEKTINSVDYGFFSYSSGRDEFIENYLKDKVDRGMEVAIATFGSKGSLAYDGVKYYEFGIFPAVVVNTVGAGDAFIAGFLSEKLKNSDIEKCLESGARLASKIVSIFEPWIRK